ncbi:MAG: cysteine rich repeat-containing protein [Rhodospirillaceae bacterium]
MIRMKAVFTALALLSLGVSPAHAQTIQFEQCQEDIAFYCQDVEPGDGRLAACLYAHTATLSDDCFAATQGIAVALEGMFDRLSNIYEACSGDIQTHCAGEEVGEGRLVKCLAGQEAALSEACSDMLPMLKTMANQ